MGAFLAGPALIRIPLSQQGRLTTGLAGFDVPASSEALFEAPFPIRIRR
jgi:hypothetical protein